MDIVEPIGLVYLIPILFGHIVTPLGLIELDGCVGTK